MSGPTAETTKAPALRLRRGLIRGDAALVYGLNAELTGSSAVQIFGLTAQFEGLQEENLLLLNAADLYDPATCITNIGEMTEVYDRGVVLGEFTRGSRRRGVVADAQTSSTLLPEEIKQHIGLGFAYAESETFEDGMDSAFAKAIETWIGAWGVAAVEVIADVIALEKAGAAASGEALKVLGRLNDAATLEWRRHLLERSLGAASPSVRDAAVVGLASIYDVRSGVALRAAADKEPVPQVRHEMIRVADYLRGR